MKIKRGSLTSFLLALAFILPTFTFGGDFGEGGGRPRIATYVELRALVGTVQRYIYLEALSLMGDVGEGGGGVRKWEQEFQTRFQRRLKSHAATTDISTRDGQRFVFVRRKMPLEEFNRFELKRIVGVRTKSHGAITVQNIYNYHLKEITNPNLAFPDVLSDLLYFETLEGIMVPPEEITEVILEFRTKP